jgi:inward rectifier potassium channel
MAKQKKEYEDLGLGEKATGGKIRTLNKDGSFNVRKSNIPFWQRVNFFHTLVTMSKLQFVSVVLVGYLAVNLIFASIYFLIGVENLTGIEGDSSIDNFLEAFFFSAQTITTLGYGRVAPISLAANIVAAVESMLGLLTFALATGMVYGRFSKPNAKIKYSNHAVIAPYKSINGFMFRLLNPHDNQLLEVEVNISMSILRDNSNLRDFHNLKLERSSVVFLPSVWTVVHPIDDNSPLHNFTDKELKAKDAEFIIVLKAFDESFSQIVYSRTSYKTDEIRWGEKFNYIIEQNEDGIIVDASRLDESSKAELN